MFGKNKLHVAGCAILIVVAVALYFSGFLGNNWTILLLLLCPIMHFFMMGDMHGKENGHGDTNNNGKSDKKTSCH